ncbi:Phage tail protein [Sulfidibacter corallicola]|uniref:Phage tail protein n=1 Tax=Sulfidibacter corallicola TaxID=2818388 RepID=A0A8A4TXY6_SULCO|nr:phage tail protein [Sulfidibacter corallicola]QTD54197.1 phage tail protein [Sulfidibacter corallicola]
MEHAGTMPKSLYQNWQFAIEINGFDVALFKKASLPKTEFDETTFSPGGSMFDQKVAGRAKFEDVNLEKGIFQDGSDEAARDWVKKIVDVNAGVSKLPSDYMRDVDLVQYDRTGSETRRWTLHGAWIKSLEYDELDGSSSENTLEKLVITYQYWT